MRRFLAPVLAVCCLLATGTIASADALGLDVTSDTQVFTPGVYHNIGWQFSVGAPITVTGFGFFDVNAPGLAQSHQIGLWDNSGTLLASATVSNGSTLVASASGAGDWLFESISPLALGPGIYVIGAFYADSADSVIANATISLDPSITFLASRASTEGAFAEPGVYGLVEPGVFGPTFSLQSEAPVPEPSSLLLLGSGLIGAAGAIRRKLIG